MLTTEEFDALCQLVNGERPALSEETAKRLIAGGYIERNLGGWNVTSRGHALVLRGTGDPPPPDAA